MKLLFENWRKFLDESPVAFHGAGMAAPEMRVPDCNTPEQDEKHGYSDNQWEAGELGCPQFSNDKGISFEHPDIQQAIQFLNNIKPKELIAYSRGGAVALAALSSVKFKPHVTFVAPAWKRGWVMGLENSTYSNGVIIHGTKDDKVPLSHSAELALRSGMKLYVFEGRGHINILKHKLDPTSGRLLSRQELENMKGAQDETSI